MCMYIIQAYVLLSPQDFFTRGGSVVIETLNSLLGDLRADGKVMAMRLFETCLRASPQQGTELIRPLLLRIFEYVNAFYERIAPYGDIENVIRVMYNRSVYNGDEYPMVMTMHLTIVARVLLGSRDIFVQVRNTVLCATFICIHHIKTRPVKMGKCFCR